MMGFRINMTRLSNFLLLLEITFLRIVCIVFYLLWFHSLCILSSSARVSPHFNNHPAIIRNQKVTSWPHCSLEQLRPLELNPFWSTVLSCVSGPFWVLHSPQCILTPQLAWSKGCWSHSSLSQICEGESKRCKKSSRKWEGQSPLEEKARARSNLCLVLFILDLHWAFQLLELETWCP